MTATEYKVPELLNEDLAEKLECRHRLLVKLLDQLDAEHGPVDESLVEKYVEILGTA